MCEIICMTLILGKQFSEYIESRCRKQLSNRTGEVKACDIEFGDDGRHERDRSSTKSIDSEYSDWEHTPSASIQRMPSPVYLQRSTERTYYSPNYCPWSRNTSSEREDSEFVYNINAMKSYLKSVSTPDALYSGLNVHTRSCLFETNANTKRLKIMFNPFKCYLSLTLRSLL